jgi:type I restriction enzyme S subunit
MADKMLNAFDVWITAQGVKSRTRLRSIDNISLDGVKRLRELILNLAVTGKLVNQDFNDESAEILLKIIFEERKQKIDSGEIKGKELLPVPKDKIKELPSGWTVARLGSLFNVVYGSGISSNQLTEEGFDVFGANGIIGKYSEYNYEESQLLISCRGAYSGKPNLSPPKCFVTSNSLILENSWKFLDKMFFYYQLSIADKKEVVSGSAQPQVTTKNLDPFVLFVPPLAEQHRIVAKVDELMALCDALEQQETQHLKSHQLLVETLLGTLTRAADADEFQHAWNKLYAHFDDLFTTEDSIDQLKQTILQLAVMGKLVSQDPNDDIDISNHSIERIDDLDKPFILPVSWRWIRWSELLAHGKYSMKRGPFGSALRKGDFVDSGIRVFEQYNPINDDPNWVRYYITPEKYEEMKAFTAGPGDLLISCSGATLGRITELTDEVEPGIINQALLKVRLNSKLISNRYFILVFRSKIIQDIIFEKALGSAIPNMVGVAELKRIVMGLPPLSEQQKIIKKLDALFALCDRLKEGIAEAQRVANQMAEGVVMNH